MGFYLIYTELNNALNHAVSAGIHEVLRINLQMKRYDRVFKVFAMSFAVLGANFVYCLILLCVRNIVY